MLILISNILYKRINTTLYREMKVVTSTLAQKIVFTYNLPIEYELGQGCQSSRDRWKVKHTSEKRVYIFLTRNYKWPKAYTHARKHARLHSTLTHAHTHISIYPHFHTKKWPHSYTVAKQAVNRSFSNTVLLSACVKLTFQLAYRQTEINNNG